MDAPFVYVVKFWVDPKGADTILHWLDSKHTAEVVAQPGFRSVRRVRLEENSPDGWHAYMMIYGLEFARRADALFRQRRAEALCARSASRSSIICAPSAAGARSISRSADRMTQTLNVLALSGSLREKSYNTALLREAVRLAPAGMTIEIASIRDIPLYDADVEARGMPPARHGAVRAGEERRRAADRDAGIQFLHSGRAEERDRLAVASAARCRAGAQAGRDHGRRRPARFGARAVSPAAGVRRASACCRCRGRRSSCSAPGRSSTRRAG